MAVIYPNYGEGFPRQGFSPALDALQLLGSASPASGRTPNPARLTEPPSDMGPQFTPPPATPPGEVSGQDQILQSLRMAGPMRKGPMQNMAPERREKPSQPAIEG